MDEHGHDDDDEPSANFDPHRYFEIKPEEMDQVRQNELASIYSPALYQMFMQQYNILLAERLATGTQIPVEDQVPWSPSLPNAYSTAVLHLYTARYDQLRLTESGGVYAAPIQTSVPDVPGPGLIPRLGRRQAADGETSSPNNDDDDDHSHGYYRRPTTPSPARSAHHDDVSNKLLVVHAVNTLNIMKRYMVQTTDELMSCQFNPQVQHYFDLGNINAKPMDLLDPAEFDCRTAVIVLVRDKQTYVDWGSQLTCLLLEELKTKKAHPMCFTLMHQHSVKTMESMVLDLPESIKNSMDLTDDGEKLERLITMSTLSRTLRYWSVPILLIDSGPKHTLDYPSILNFANRANIKVVKFGACEKSSKDIDRIKMKCRAKVDEIMKSVNEAYTMNFKKKWQEGYVSVQAARCVNDIDKVFLEVTESPNSASVMSPASIRSKYFAPLRDTSAIAQDIEMSTIKHSVPQALTDANEWIGWEQPYYDRKEAQRQVERERREKALKDSDPHVQTEVDGVEAFEIVADDGDDCWESLSESEDDLSTSQRSEPTDIKFCLEDQLQGQSNNSSDDPCGEEDSPRTIEEVFCYDDMPGLSHVFDESTSPIPIRIPEASSSVETSDVEDVDNLEFKFIQPISRQFFRSIEPVPVELRYDKNTINNPVTSAEKIQIKMMLTVFDKNQKLKRLLKYYKKMKKDYKSVNKGTEPRVTEELDFTKGYTQGRSCCLDIQLDEWGLYWTPINLVLSAYEVEYLKKKMVTVRLPYATNFMGWVMREATSVFIDSIIHVCCGARPLPGAINQRQRIKSIIFIHDNNDVLELLTNALWFCGKTVLSTCQSQYYAQEGHFDKSLEACKSYVREDVTDEPLYLDWLGVGMNQTLKDDECRFLIVDFPRPGKQLSSAFETVMKRLQMEYRHKGIDTLYISKSACRADNLATVENVLDQIQNKMPAKDRILFRKSRKIYLDAKLYKSYEMECKDDEKRGKEWGLPPMDGSRLWEQLRLKQFQLLTKSSQIGPILNPDGSDNNNIVDVGCFEQSEVEDGSDDDEEGSENGDVIENDEEGSENGDVIENDEEAEADHETYSDDDFDALFEETPEGSVREADSDIAFAETIEGVDDHSDCIAQITEDFNDYPFNASEGIEVLELETGLTPECEMNIDDQETQELEETTSTSETPEPEIPSDPINVADSDNFEESITEIQVLKMNTSKFNSDEESLQSDTDLSFSDSSIDDNEVGIINLPLGYLSSTDEDEACNENQALSLRRCEGVTNLVDQDLFHDDDYCHPEQEIQDPIADIHNPLDNPNREDIKINSIFRTSSNDYLKNMNLIRHCVSEIQAHWSRRSKNIRKVHPLDFDDNENDWDVVPETITGTPELENQPDCKNIKDCMEILPANSQFQTNTSVTSIAELSFHLEEEIIPIIEDKTVENANPWRLSFAKIFRSRVSPETLDPARPGTIFERPKSEHRQNPQRFQFVEMFLKLCRALYSCCRGVRDINEVD